MFPLLIAFVHLFKMAEHVEQRICIKSYVKLDTKQTLKIKCVQGNEAIGATQIKQWYSHIKVNEQKEITFRLCVNVGIC